MATDFSRTLSLLRQEKGISQRKAAGEMGISQALLSHYENGIREPGLAFVVKACDYYHVSADYLLGRTLSRDGAIIGADDLYDSTGEKGTLKGSILATLQKKLVVNTANVLFDLLGKTGSRQAINAAGDYLSAALYQLLRQLYRRCGGNEDFFAVSAGDFDAGSPRPTCSEAPYTICAHSARRKSSPRSRPRASRPATPASARVCAGVPQHGRALQDAVRSAARRLAQAFI